MKKLTTMFAVVAFAASLGATGCKKKNAEEGKDTPNMKTEEGSGSGSAAAAPMAGSDKKADGSAAAPAAADGSAKAADGSAAAPAAAGGDSGLPAECNDYKALMDKYFSCDKIPQAARDAGKAGFEQTWKAWADMPAAAKSSLGAACKTAAEASKTMVCPS